MKNIFFARPVKKGMQVFLLLAMLFVNFSPAGTGAVHAIGPNDNLADAIDIPEAEISYTNLQDVALYSTETNEPAIPVIPVDKTCDGNKLELGYKTAWYKFTPATAQLVSFNTYGTDYDTYIAIWSTTNPSPAFADLSFVSCDDDTNVGYQSQVVIDITQTDIDNGITYYIQVAKFNCILGAPTCPGPDEETDPSSLVFSASFKNIEVAISGTVRGNYNIPPGETGKQTYSSVNTGPLQVISDLDEDQLVSSMRVIYTRGGKKRSYSELMGFPAVQATTEYYFPWYTKNATTDSQLRIANVGDQPTTVHVYIKGVKKSGTGYVLAPGTSITKAYSGVNNGPVRVVSTVAGVNIIASMRVIYKYKAVGTTTYVGMSYSEMMGYPANQATTEYLFPRYKTKSGVTSQLRVANVGSQTTTVQVNLGGTLKGPYTLAPGAAKLIPTFANLDIGPVKVISTNPAVNIVASMRQIYKQSGIPQSYSEILGYPADQLATEYQFPWYTNNATLVSNFRIVNVDDQDTDVSIYIAGNLMETFSLTQGASALKFYSNVDSGPVRVVSTNPALNIIVSLEMTYKQSGKGESYSELIGFPYISGAPIMEYLFPWYTNNTGSTSYNSELRFGYP